MENAAAPPELDTMLDKLVSQVDFAPPLADFLYRDPYANVRGMLQYGLDLGLNDVNGMSCHALAFVEKDIDWQIWIQDGPQLIPCKLVITYKTRPAQPQFTAVFTDCAEPLPPALVPVCANASVSTIKASSAALSLTSARQTYPNPPMSALPTSCRGPNPLWSLFTSSSVAIS